MQLEKTQLVPATANFRVKIHKNSCNFFLLGIQTSATSRFFVFQSLDPSIYFLLLIHSAFSRRCWSRFLFLLRQFRKKNYFSKRPGKIETMFFSIFRSMECLRKNLRKINMFPNFSTSHATSIKRGSRKVQCKVDSVSWIPFFFQIVSSSQNMIVI